MKIIVFLIFLTSNAYAETIIGKDSGNPIPRFVSLKSNETNLRIGPSKNYPIILQYSYKNIPVMVIDEFDKWRKVIDFENNEGWIHLSLLSSNRFGLTIVKNNEFINIFKNPEKDIIGQIGSRNIVELNKCLSYWCHIKIEKYKGWAKKTDLWGVFKDENFD